MKNPEGAETLESMNLAVWFNQWILNKFRKYLTGDILEVGFGTGNFTKFLNKYKTVWIIDINDEYIRKTKKLVGKKVQVGFGDIEENRYFFENRNFDSIVCLNVLEHVQNDDLALQNLYKLLNNKGKLILLVPSHQFLYGEIDKSIGHFRRYSKLKFERKLEKMGFKIISARRLNLLGAIGWYIAGKILKEKVVKEGKIKIFNLIAPLIVPIEDLFEPPIGTSILVIAEKP